MTQFAPTIPYVGQGAARVVWGCTDREVVIEGPAGTGKTRAVCEKLAAVCNGMPGVRVLACRKTRASMTESVLVTFERDVWPGPNPLKLNQKRTHRTEYAFDNGSCIVVGGMDSPERILSTEYDIIACFQAEEFTLNDWEMLLSRLRNNRLPYQQAIADCNPAHPGHWLNKRASAGGMTRLLSRHRDNPTVTPDYLSTLQRLTGARRMRLYEGKWAGSEGVVYDRWDRAVHVKAREGPWARVIVGVDDGYTNPCAVLRMCVDGDGRIHVEAESYQRGRSETERVAMVRGLESGSEVAVVDPSAAGLRAALSMSGLSVIEADNDVLAGISRVGDRLAISGDGLPRCTVDPSCTNLIDEFESYEWLPEKPKDTPKKENDHALDALRYAVMHVDGGGTYSGSSTIAEDHIRKALTADEFQQQLDEGNRARVAALAAWDRAEDIEP